MHMRTRNMLLKVGTLVLMANVLTAASAVGQTKKVAIVNTPNVRVTNTPAVNVANTPTVNVGNTANVNLVNNPSVQVSGTVAVDVKNDAAAPVLTRSADEPARHFFQKNFTALVQNGNVGGGGANIDLGSVPANTVLVLEYVDLVALTSQTLNLVAFQSGLDLSAPPLDTLAFVPIKALNGGLPSASWVVGQPVKMYVAANNHMQLFVGSVESLLSCVCVVELSGYLVSQ